MRIATLFVLVALAAAPAYAQTELSFVPTAAVARINGDLNYSVYGVGVEAARYFWNGRIGATGELGYASGTGILSDSGKEIGVSITTALAGVRARFPIGRFVPSVRFAAGTSGIGFSSHHGQPADRTYVLAAVVGGALDIRMSPKTLIRIQPDLFFRGACPGGPVTGDGYQVRVSVGGVFAW